MIATRCVLDSNVPVYHSNGILNDGLESIRNNVRLSPSSGITGSEQRFGNAGSNDGKTV
ncbi:MAG: hypothetical protein BECKG1743D_GA0114223_110423 [Candidatus Kentron sp. G]|nr:MAG: hypothetical protein BECKG1743F_GA0114225_109543 [Candidatus Kentron sp. G]VFN06321.1 MAG: hypothetical protein BECKG1743E_GA0114224_109983 [Candidatus Kentron sp. G]VFN07354.1 MAG: hypothetical protein BECKG1743D_GA0114223_110423 [Candidatus Kentron sp. G]